MTATVLFYLYAGIAVAGALGLVAAKRLVHAVMSLFATLSAVAALFLLGGSEYLAGMQLFVYGGAITILVLFVLMLTREGTQLQASDEQAIRPSRMWLAGGSVVLLLGTLLITFSGTAWPQGAASDTATSALADTLFSKYVIPFEIAGLILTVALLGAVIIARDDEPARLTVPEPADEHAAPPAPVDLEGAGETA